MDARVRMGDFHQGSQRFGLRDGTSQSLAGRFGTLQLLPVSLAHIRAARLDSRSLEDTVWQGGYPALFESRHAAAALPGQWFSACIASYIERDVRQVLEVGNLSSFQRFALMCASRTGALLNLAALAADCGISQPTARSWLSVLEASYVVRLLQPFHQNPGKRLVKT